MICLRSLVTRNPPGEVSTSIAGHPRVQSSTTVNVRMTLPLLTQLLTRSNDHFWLRWSSCWALRQWADL
jgi:hypothetical protein